MKLLSRCAGSTRAAPRDGVSRARRTWSSTRAQRIRRARDRRRTERRDAVARKPRGDRRDRVAAVERVDALDAVHVDVDEAGNDVVTVKGECGVRDPMTRRIESRRCGRRR